MEALILSATAKQFIVRPHFDDRPSGQHHDPIGLLNRGQTMGNDEGRSPLHQIGKSQLDDSFGLGIQCRCRFVENKQGRVS